MHVFIDEFKKTDSAESLISSSTTISESFIEIGDGHRNRGRDPMEIPI